MVRCIRAQPLQGRVSRAVGGRAAPGRMAGSVARRPLQRRPSQKLGGVTQKSALTGSVPRFMFQCGSRDG